MAFKRKEDTGGGEAFKFETVGQTLTGYYLGSQDFQGDFAPTKKHVFKTDNGVKVVFGQTHLISLLEGVETGVLVRVTYDSKKKTNNGSPMKVYTLDIDDEQKIDAAELPEANDWESSEDDSEEATDEVVTAPAKAAPAATAPSASAKSRVEALLKGGRNKVA